MLICWTDRTWTDGHFITIPVDTPEGQIEEAGRKSIIAHYDGDRKTHGSLRKADEIAYICLYNSNVGEVEPDKDVPKRSEIAVTLSFDLDQITTGSEIEQQAAAVDVVNLTLQREPFGLGASIK